LFSSKARSKIPLASMIVLIPTPWLLQTCSCKAGGPALISHRCDLLYKQ
jgi:hypothetical protein